MGWDHVALTKGAHVYSIHVCDRCSYQHHLNHSGVDEETEILRLSFPRLLSKLGSGIPVSYAFNGIVLSPRQWLRWWLST